MKSGIIIHPNELTESMTEIILDAKIGCLGIHPSGGENASKTAEEYVNICHTKEFSDKLKKIRRAGIAIENEIHALSYILPRTLFSVHPDWFRLDENGNRTPDVNMCPSNSEALNFISQSAAKLAKILPSDTGRYYFWIDDVAGKKCNCEKCRRLSESEQALLIYNAILKGIKKIDSSATHCFLAYSAKIEADENGNYMTGTFPVPENIEPENGIFLEYAPFRYNTLTEFSKTPENDRLRKKIAPLVNYFGSKNAQVLEYWMDNSLHSRWTYPPKKLIINTETIRADIDFYKSCGFEEIKSFGCFLSDDYSKLYGIPPIKEYSDCF